MQSRHGVYAWVLGLPFPILSSRLPAAEGTGVPRLLRHAARSVRPARLAGVEAPKFEDNESTIDQLKARIAKTIAYTKTLDARQIDGAGDREITFPLGPTNKGHMKGDDYLNHFVLPNFYFHLTAAYAILRHCGVEVGKRDFLGQIPLKMT